MNAIVKILAKNPPSIGIVVGAALVMAGHAGGWAVIFASLGLNVLWILGRYS